MLAKLLQLELVLKGGAGLMLLLLPVTTARMLGLPYEKAGFWARLLGAVLIGIAGAIYIEHDVKDVRGLGLPGLLFINIVAVLALTAIAVTSGVGSRRGKAAIWFTIAILFGFVLLQILQL